MKKIVLLMVVGMAFVANAISLDVKPIGNTKDECLGIKYSIKVKREKWDNGKYVVYAMSFVKFKKGGDIVPIPSSIKQIPIENVGYTILEYTTPRKTTAELSILVILGDVYICVCNTSTPKKSIVRKFKTTFGKCPSDGIGIDAVASDKGLQERTDFLGIVDIEPCELKKVD